MTALLQLTLVRHGETAWSLTGQHTGRSDLPLTDHGRLMASQLAASMTALPFDLVLSSPSLRARDTCALAGLGGNATIDDDLAEWHYGLYEGLRTAQIHQQRPDWDVWRDGCPGGESVAEVGARADRLIGKMLLRLAVCQPAVAADGAPQTLQRVALFSHGQFGRALAARWIGLAVDQGRHFALDPASLSQLGFDAAHPQRRIISLWNAGAATLAAGEP